MNMVNCFARVFSVDDVPLCRSPSLSLSLHIEYISVVPSSDTEIAIKSLVGNIFRSYSTRYIFTRNSSLFAIFFAHWSVWLVIFVFGKPCSKYAGNTRTPNKVGQENTKQNQIRNVFGASNTNFILSKGVISRATIIHFNGWSINVARKYGTCSAAYAYILHTMCIRLPESKCMVLEYISFIRSMQLPNSTFLVFYVARYPPLYLAHLFAGVVFFCFPFLVCIRREFQAPRQPFVFHQPHRYK